jgi:hypothetical protein
LRARAAKSIALITIKNNKDRLVSHLAHKKTTKASTRSSRGVPAVIQGVFLRVRSRKDLPPKFLSRVDWTKQTLKKAGCSLDCVSLGFGTKKTLEKAGCSLDSILGRQD